jgi:hypothetical protein
VLEVAAKREFGAGRAALRLSAVSGGKSAGQSEPRSSHGRLWIGKAGEATVGHGNVYF